MKEKFENGIEQVRVRRSSGISYGYDSKIDYATPSQNDLIFEDQKFINIDNTGIFVCDNYKYLDRKPTQAILVLEDIEHKQALKIEKRAQNLENADKITISDAYPFEDEKFAYRIVFHFPEYKNTFWKKSEKNISEDDLFAIACKTALKYNIPMMDIPPKFDAIEVARINEVITPKKHEILSIPHKFYELKRQHMIVEQNDLKKLI